jgi:hypothetical protein
MIKVTRDLLGIAERLKKINPAYRVFYNNRHNRFEVHAGNELAFIPPFDCLDTRTIDYAYKTRKQNLDALEKEIDKSNEEFIRSGIEEIEKQVDVLGEMLCFANRAGHNVTFTKKFIKEY